MGGFWETDPNVVPHPPRVLLTAGITDVAAAQHQTGSLTLTQQQDQKQQQDQDQSGPAAGPEPAAGPWTKGKTRTCYNKEKNHSFYPKTHRHCRNFESPELSSSVVSPTFSPTLNSSACDCGRSELCFPKPFLFLRQIPARGVEQTKAFMCPLRRG